MLARWLLAFLTSVAVMLLVYHFAVPRTWLGTACCPGPVLSTAVWFPTTWLWHVRLHFAVYGVVYGSLATAMCC